MKTIQTDNKIIEKLKLKTLSRFICDTDKGTLKLQLRKGENTYHLVLDSIPLEKELNEELMGLLFPAPITQTEPNKKDITSPSYITKVIKLEHEKFKVDTRPLEETPITLPPKKIGRPKGSKTGDSTMK